MDDTVEQEATPIEIEGVSRLEAILDNPTNKWEELSEVKRLAPALAETHPELSRRVIASYFEPHIPKFGVSNGFGVEEHIIPILSALGDNDQIRRKVTHDYISAAVAAEMREVTTNNGRVSFDDLARIVFLATKNSPGISADIGRALIENEGRLRSSIDYDEDSYASKHQYSKDADHWYGRLMDRKFQYRNVAIPLLALAGQIAIDDGNKELGQEVLDKLAKYKDEVAEAKKSFDRDQHDNPTSTYFLNYPNTNMIAGSYTPFGISYRAAEIYYNATSQLSNFATSGKPS